MIPGDVAMQRAIIEVGFDLLAREITGMTIVDLPFRLRRFGRA